jgi:hypothetical protein
MKNIVSLFFAFLLLMGCSGSFNSTELDHNFNESEKRDLELLTNFFQEQMCHQKSDFSNCMDSIIPFLGEYGWMPILENVNFEEQQKLYDSFESKLFSEIWSFCKFHNPKEGWERKSLCLNIDGKYMKFLKDLAENNSDLKDYYELMYATGDWESMGLLQGNLYTKPENYDLRDPNIQILIAVHYLTQNDQQKRKEPWTENK